MDAEGLKFSIKALVAICGLFGAFSVSQATMLYNQSQLMAKVEEISKNQTQPDKIWTVQNARVFARDLAKNPAIGSVPDVDDIKKQYP